jgi:sulfur-oxidizing protein SoxX
MIYINQRRETMSYISKPLVAVAATAVLLVGGMTIPLQTVSAGDEASAVEKGKKIASERKLGNCLACHLIEGNETSGTIAPPLIGMKARYPDKKKLHDQIWDATVANPESSMPPFGRHKILNDDQINDVVEYIHSL